MSQLEYDLVVIGSGPAGIHSSVQAAKLGKKVCVVEATESSIGGSWIHTGTLPSKTLRESLATIHSIRHHAGEAWVERIIDDLHTGKLFKRAREVSKLEEEMVNKFLKKNKIDVYKGFGKIKSENLVEVQPIEGESYEINAKNILIATGSRPRRPKEIPFDGWRVIDGNNALQLDQIPRSMVIFGAGVIGAEYACIFASFGVKLTLIDRSPEMMPYLDSEVVSILKDAMNDLGITIKLGSDIKDVKVDGPKVKYSIDDEEFETDCFFFCAGRLPNSENIGLENLGIKISNRGAIEVNDDFQTSVPNIYAAGDVIGPPSLAATSSEQGRHVSCHAFKAKHGEFPKVFPFGIYTIPEISMVGKTEKQLQEEGTEFVVGRAFSREVARGYIRGDKNGILKLLICKKTHKILGVHIIGGDASNLVHIGLAFMMRDGVAQDFIDMIFNHPTLAEAYRIAAFNALNKLFPDGLIGAPPESST